MKKKILSAAMAAIACTGVAFADPVLVRDVAINQQSVAQNEIEYLPLRAVGEALGYGVKWNPSTFAAELHGSSVNSFYIRNSTAGKDQMPVEKLEHNILVKDGVSYVAAEDLEKQLGILVQQEAGEVKILAQLNEFVQMGGLTITSIDEKGRVTAAQGEGIAYVDTKDAKIMHYGSTSPAQITEADYGKEMFLTVPSIMIMIYPPQHQAKEVVILPKEVTVMTGSVSIVSQGASPSVLIKTGQTEYLVWVDEDTELVNTKGEAITLDQIKPGNEIVAFHSYIMTRSMPGQTQGFKLIVGTPGSAK